MVECVVCKSVASCSWDFSFDADLLAEFPVASVEEVASTVNDSLAQSSLMTI